MHIYTLLLMSETLRNIMVPGLIVLSIAAILGLLIVIVSNVFSMPIDETKEALLAVLPGANCGGCGFAGCEGYAKFLADGSTDTSMCSVGGEACAMELASILGVAPSLPEPKVVHLLCQGTREHTSPRYDYRGTASCNAAHGLLGGPGSCTYGCMGFGDCIAVCSFHALSRKDGIITVDENACTACGMCVKICPKNLLQLFPKTADVAVRCKNSWPGNETRKNCTIGCIGCKKCEKACPSGAIKMNGPLASVDQGLCIHCNACVAVCPTHAITSI